MVDGLVLRDLHLSTAPSWWPPAPGWWLVAGALLALAFGVLGWRLQRLRRRRRLLALFDAETSGTDANEVVAAISSLLRRAGRRIHPDADHLAGQDWLAFLDQGREVRRFDGARGALLLEGAYRPGLDLDDVADLRAAARERFIEWMARR
ncbi:hypothetical protein GCM10007164_23850 [Luteimonas padinae]|uniref:DUF4381 domain-containing protein n=1 Tax=Luteimonas padinae TaxID=1714359 RepID=A0ABV6SVU6_9GAMM|nr:DUF4381 domain-containing protein [Luteimonas padinae]GHD73969.1 hypothetical protein GCM10007164_23850 [Luteimonas padinae]